MWGGQPLLGQAQPGAAYFLNWLLYSMPLKNGVLNSDIIHWYFAVIHVMGAVFCYALCRDLGRSVLASFFAGLTFSLTSYLAATGWPQMMNGAVWAPLVLLFLIRCVEKRDGVRNAAMCGLCLGLAWLSGHHQVPIFLSLASGLTWLFYVFRGRRMDTDPIRYAAIAFAICGLIAALQILPAREYGIQSVRWVIAGEPVGWNVKVPYAAHETLSMSPTSILGIVFPNLASISEPYVGFTAFTLALIAVLTRWRHDARVRLFVFLGIGGFLYAFGSNAGLEGVAYILLPIIEKARTPGAAIFLFGLSAAVLASYGIDTVGRRIARPHLLRSPQLLAITALLVFVGMFALVLARQERHQALTMAAIYALLLAALLAALRVKALRYRHAIGLCLVLLWMEATSIHIVGGNKRTGDQMEYLNGMNSHADAAEYLSKQQPPFRIFIAGNEIPGNWAAHHDLDGVTGYLASLSLNIRTVPMHNRNTQLLWGARFALGGDHGSPADTDVFTSKSGRTVILRPEAFPRSWVVHRIEKKATREQIGEQAEKDLPSFTSKAFMTGTGPSLDTCDGASESADYRRPTADTVVVKAKLACKGMVVVSDTFFPGWKAEVDGQAADILEVNAAMRGVVVPAGEHTLTMRYRPNSVYLGAFLTVIGLAAVIATRFMRK